jgi:SAM-dependent methyltransferase
MAELHRFANPSLCIKRPERNSEQTVIIAGSGRGGTSAVALMVALLGVPFPTSADPSSFDDLTIGQHKGDTAFFGEENRGVYEHYLDLVRREFCERNRLSPIWATKDTLVPFWLPDLLETLRNPVLICVTRDATAVAQRACLSTPGCTYEHFPGFFSDALNVYGRLIEQITRFDLPCLFISYERLLRRIKDTAFDICSFLNLSPSDEALIAISGTIAADRISADVSYKRRVIGGERPTGSLFQFDLGNAGGCPKNKPTDLASTVIEVLDLLQQRQFETAAGLVRQLPALLLAQTGIAINSDRLSSLYLDDYLRDIDAYHIEIIFLYYYGLASDLANRSVFSQAYPVLSIAKNVAQYVIAERKYLEGICFGSFWSLLSLEAEVLLESNHPLAALERLAFISATVLDGRLSLEDTKIGRAPRDKNLAPDTARWIKQCRASLTALGCESAALSCESKEGRIVDRRQMLLRRISREQYGIEIGPNFNPLAAKRDGYRCLSLDVFDIETLKSRALNDPLVSNDRIQFIENVDIVGSSTLIEQLVAARNELGSFDYIIASHSFEHLPNPIKFLQGCGRVLKEGGLLSMAIPDKRACFDYFRPRSTLGEWAEAFLADRDRPSFRQIFEQNSLHARLKVGDDLRASFSLQDDPGNVIMLRTLRESYEQWRKRLAEKDDRYYDCHCWTFTPGSFRLLMTDCAFIGLSPFDIVEITDTHANEFHVHLRNVGYRVYDKTATQLFYDNREAIAHTVENETGFHSRDGFVSRRVSPPS